MKIISNAQIGGMGSEYIYLGATAVNGTESFSAQGCTKFIAVRTQDTVTFTYQLVRGLDVAVWVSNQINPSTYLRYSKIGYALSNDIITVTCTSIKTTGWQENVSWNIYGAK